MRPLLKNMGVMVLDKISFLLFLLALCSTGAIGDDMDQFVNESYADDFYNDVTTFPSTVPTARPSAPTIKPTARPTEPFQYISPNVELIALKKFYNATGGDNWLWRTIQEFGPHWDFNVTNGIKSEPCYVGNEWQGITCKCEEDRGTPFTFLCNVTSITLSGYRLIGSIPDNSLSALVSLESLEISDNERLGGEIPWDSLVGLPQLTDISLDRNALTGTLPNSIGSMVNLQNLALNNNSLHATLPSSLGNLKNLIVLNLGSNDFKGTLPVLLGELSNLVRLYVFDTFIGGTVPSSLGNLLNLETLRLDNNNMNGTLPENLLNCKNLTTLNLDRNHFTGVIPAWLGKFAMLQTLSMSNNAFHGGTIPPELGNCSLLQGLFLGGNKITGTIPQELTRLKNLSKLDLNNNELRGNIPDWLPKFEVLERIQLENNRFTGPLPDSIGNCSHLHTIDLQHNRITSTLPPSLGNPNNVLKELNFYNMNLTGTIPAELGQSRTIKIFNAFNNNLTGTLPPELSTMRKLANLELYNNQLSKSIPDSFGNLTELITLLIGNNRLTGTLPASLGRLRFLISIEAPNNFLEGSLPSELAGTNFSVSPSLRTLILSHNLLTNSIPDAFVRFRRVMTTLKLSNNALTGTIPDFFSNFTKLSSLYLNHNLLHGPIPDFGNLSSLYYVELQNNLLTGSLPDSVGNWSKINLLSVSNNALTGSIPYSLVDLPVIFQLYLGTNSFTGSLPPLGLIFQPLIEFTANDNFLTGTLPASFLVLKNLLMLEVQNNQLSSTLPPGLGADWPLLEELFLYGNAFSGTIPVTVSAMTSLVTLQLQKNLLRGPIDNVFNPNTQKLLNVIQLGNNRLSSTIPSEVFQLGNLSVFIAVTNCLKGPLPETICQSTSLNTLLLDGLSTATACNKKILGGKFPSVYGLKYSFKGGLNPCFFSMPSLEVLHLSGNGLTGSLPSNMSRLLASSGLSTLVLSHNALSGAIPDALQERQWNTLDFSFNKLSGLLNSNFSNSFENENNTELRLKVNRLSGTIPKSLQQAYSLTILEGNMYECNLAGDSLPNKDPDKDIYSCGSDIFNVPYYFFLGMVSVTLLILVICWTCFYQDSTESTSAGAAAGLYSGSEVGQIIQLILSWINELQVVWTDDMESELEAERDGNDGNEGVEEKDDEENRGKHSTTLGPQSSGTLVAASRPTITTRPSLAAIKKGNPLNVRLFSHLLQAARQLSMSFAIYDVLVWMPVYVSCTVYFGTFARQYAWTASASFLTGPDALTILLTALVVFMCIFVVVYHAVMSYVPRSSSYRGTIGARGVGTWWGRVTAYGGGAEKERGDSRSGRSASSGIRDHSRSRSKDNSRSRYESQSMSMDSRYSFRDSTFVVNTMSVTITHGLCWVTIIAINFTVVILANVGYVLVSVYGTKYQYGLFAAQFFLAMFKIAWNGSILRYIAHTLLAFVNDITLPEVKKALVLLEVMAAIFNNIIVPCLVVAAIDPDCFNSLLIAPDPVSASYQYQDCQQYSIQQNGTDRLASIVSSSCVQYNLETSTTTFKPPFLYSYQCTSSFTTYYAPTFIFFALMVTFLLPLMQYTMHWLYSRQIQRVSSALTEFKKREILAEKWFQLLNMAVPRLLRASAIMTYGVSKTIIPGLDPEDENYDGARYFDSTSCLVMMSTLLGLSLTFGLTFPPLGVALTISVLAYTFTTQLKVGRFLFLARKYKEIIYIQVLNSECAIFEESPRRWMWVFVSLGCWFYGFILFDTLGNAKGYQSNHAYWTLVVAGVMPIGLYIIYWVFEATGILDTCLFRLGVGSTAAVIQRKRRRKKNRKPSDIGYEMRGSSSTRPTDFTKSTSLVSNNNNSIISSMTTTNNMLHENGNNDNGSFL